MIKINNVKGITLIALVITIVVMLILVTITIISLNGKNSLFKQTNRAKKEHLIGEAKEKLEIKILDFKAEKLGSNSLEEFADFLSDDVKNGIYEVEKIYNNSGNSEEIEQLRIIDKKVECSFLINKQFNVIGPEKINVNIEATYQEKSQDGEMLNIEITINSNFSMEKIICPDNTTINCKESKEIKFDYKVEHNKDYTFIINVNDEEKTYILNTNDNTKIEEIKSESYPIIKDTGVIAGEKVNINYEQSGKTYYSLDDGKTWTQYQNSITVLKTGTIKFKNILDNKITKIISKDITVSLASDALGSAAYDGDDATYAVVKNGTSIKVIIDKSLWNEAVSLTLISNNAGTFKNIIEAIDEGGNVLNQYGTIGAYNWNNYAFNIPENTKYLRFRPSSYDNRFSFYVYEIGPYETPKALIENCYPKIMSDRIEKEHKLVTLKPFKNTVKIVYKINDSEWQEYIEPVKVSVGETIYYKAIKNNGKESPEKTYTCTKLSDSIEEKVFDNNISTYINLRNGATRRMAVDSSIWGKEIYITGHENALPNNGKFSCSITAYLNDGTNCNIYTTQTQNPSYTKKAINIPENTEYLVVYGGDYETVVWELREIEV